MKFDVHVSQDVVTSLCTGLLFIADGMSLSYSRGYTHILIVLCQTNMANNTLIKEGYNLEIT